MDALLNSFFADPMQYVGIVFAFIAAIGMVIFMAGFFAGLPHFFTLSTHDGHQAHHRLRVTWGFMLLLYTFIIWEFVRIVASWFGYPAPQNTGGFITFVTTLVIVIVALWVIFAIKDRIVSGGH